jgi:hypothetical protein
MAPRDRTEPIGAHNGTSNDSSMTYSSSHDDSGITCDSSNLDSSNVQCSQDGPSKMKNTRSELLDLVQKSVDMLDNVEKIYNDVRDENALKTLPCSSDIPHLFGPCMRIQVHFRDLLQELRNREESGECFFTPDLLPTVVSKEAFTDLFWNCSYIQTHAAFWMANDDRFRQIVESRNENTTSLGDLLAGRHFTRCFQFTNLCEDYQRQLSKDDQRVCQELADVTETSMKLKSASHFLNAQLAVKDAFEAMAKTIGFPHLVDPPHRVIRMVKLHEVMSDGRSQREREFVLLNSAALLVSSKGKLMCYESLKDLRVEDNENDHTIFLLKSCHNINGQVQHPIALKVSDRKERDDLLQTIHTAKLSCDSTQELYLSSPKHIIASKPLLEQSKALLPVDTCPLCIRSVNKTVQQCEVCLKFVCANCVREATLSFHASTKKRPVCQICWISH